MIARRGGPDRVKIPRHYRQKLEIGGWGTAFVLRLPSEPDWRTSRIRLSRRSLSFWLPFQGLIFTSTLAVWTSTYGKAGQTLYSLT